MRKHYETSKKYADKIYDSLMKLSAEVDIIVDNYSVSRMMRVIIMQSLYGLQWIMKILAEEAGVKDEEDN